MIFVKTPYRLSLLGGTTDYPHWYEKHGGAVLVTTIDKNSYVTLRRLPPYFEHKTRVAWSKIEMVRQNLDIEHPGIRGVLQYLSDNDSGLEIHYDSDIPAKSGMGSSSAFIVGLLNAYWHLSNAMPPRALTLAKTAIRIEREYVGDCVGIQDQIAAAYGGVNRVIIDRAGGFEVKNMPMTRLGELESRLLLVFTGFTRHASEIAVQQMANIEDHQDRMMEMVMLAHRGAAILQDPSVPLERLFELIERSWEIKRALSPAVVTTEICRLESRIRSKGALAVKLIGAGGGGFFLVCCRPLDRARMQAELSDLITIPVKFSFAGSQVIFKNGD